MGSRSALCCALLARQRCPHVNPASFSTLWHAPEKQWSPMLAPAGASLHSTCPSSAPPCSLHRGFAASTRLPGGAGGPEVRLPCCIGNCATIQMLHMVSSGMHAMQSSPAAAARGGRLHWSFLLIPAGVAAFLGTWQVGRRTWKVDQITQREAALQVGLAPRKANPFAPPAAL